MQSIITAAPAATITATTDKVGNIWTAYAADLDASPKTRATYERALKRYAAYLDGHGLEPLQATRETILSYRQALAATCKPATVNAYLTAVRSFYAWTDARRVYPNVAAGIKGQRMNSRSAKEALTIDQAAHLLAAPGEGATLEQLRDHAILALMTRRGLRTCEVVRADVGDVRQVAGQAVLYVQGKGYTSKGDFVVLGSACLEPLNHYLTARGKVDDSEPLFAGIGNRNQGGRMTTRSISRIAKKLMGAAGIDSPRITAHSLRHTAVTFALMGGATVQETQAMARHADISTTMVYAHNLNRANAAAERATDNVLDNYMRAAV